MDIRVATREDAEAISALIHGLAHYFTLDPNGVGAEEFLKTIAPKSIAEYISARNFCYRVGIVGGVLAGVVAVRDNKHLYHLFVSPQFQKRGLSAQLWNYIKAESIRLGSPGEFTVNSTPYAVPVYEAFGFKATGDKIETKGIAFVPMKLSVQGLAHEEARS
jgi:GNAT superfamily N-acetyltransferase